MSFDSTLLLRTRRMIAAQAQEPLGQILPASRLGLPPIGWSTAVIRGQFRTQLNGERRGFADILRTNVPRNALSTSRTVAQVAEIVKARSNVKTIGEYVAKQRETVRILLRRRLQQLNPGANIEPGTPLPSLINQQQAEQLRERLVEDLRKYLFSRITLSDLNATFATAVQRVTGRTVLL